MSEILSRSHVAICANCDLPIERMHGDLGTDQWFHRVTGKKACRDAPVAEPCEGSVEEWTA